ncbi:hypothetical protein L5G28_00505 [Gordonia sp. HY285]|uniref:hypothetical protein n=1 Tax=Gordonia liuliyuniae TaxID=2911517 RepID=UPI001F33E46F|nr:hypothetical protein [Gordonia liuliyuniae]MCF8608648.1 hypothetical protein [Gordonia liuliyuniae]
MAHQKIAVIDDKIAFGGGIDMTVERWDTSDHTTSNEYRVTPTVWPRYLPIRHRSGPDDLEPIFTGVTVGVSRTLPAYRTRTPRRSPTVIDRRGKAHSCVPIASVTCAALASVTMRSPY